MQYITLGRAALLVLATLPIGRSGGRAAAGAPDVRRASVVQPSGPVAAVEELLAADRAFATAARTTGLVEALAVMFADSVRMPVPGTLWAEGKEQVVAALSANVDNGGAHAEWAPIRGGVSADAQHGFTFGYMTVRKADGTAIPMKYMSYWVRRRDGWRVAAYKRQRRAAGDVSLAMMAPWVPPLTMKAAVPAAIAAAKRGLQIAEQRFSDTAQVIGLTAAFAQTGAPDAVNMGPGPAFIVGPAAISASVGGPNSGAGSPFVWKADDVLVAASGDLGVTFGLIRSTKNPSATPSPFFTIWRRDFTSRKWQYIAE